MYTRNGFRSPVLLGLVLSLLIGLVIGLTNCSSTPAPTTAPTTAPKTTPAAPAKEVSIRIMGSGSTSTAFVWGQALATLAGKYAKNLKIDVIPTKGTIESTVYVEQGEGEYANTYEWILREANAGTGAFTSLGKAKNLRLIYPGVVQNYGTIMVLDKSPLKEFSAATIKGKKVGSREAGSQGAGYCDLALKSIGIEPGKDVKVIMVNLADNLAALSDGTTDLFITVMGTPNGNIDDLAMAKGLRFLAPPKEVAAAGDKTFGMIPAIMPPGAVAKVTNAPALQLPTLWAIAAKLDTNVVYELTKLWWEHIDERNALHPSILDGTVENLKAIVPTSGTPLHDGALKYYREKGWLK